MNEQTTENGQDNTATDTTTEKPKRRNKSIKKGGTWERRVGRELSLWLTHGEKGDLFRRNILSGGQYTQSLKKLAEAGIPGDISAAHPKAFDFLTHFCVEVKHNNNLLLSQYLLTPRTSFIGRTVEKTREQATNCGLNWLFIGKIDHRPPFMLMSHSIGMLASSASSPDLPGGTLTRHSLFNDTIMLFDYEEFRDLVDPDIFLAAVKGGTDAADERSAPDIKSRRQLPVASVRRPLPPVEAGP